MQPTLCAWNFTPARRDSLRSLCDDLGARLRIVTPAEAGIPVGLLPLREPAAGIAMMPFREEMLLMAGFPDAMIDKLLISLRILGLTVARKAVLTPFNERWDSSALYRALSEEAASVPPRG